MGYAQRSVEMQEMPFELRAFARVVDEQTCSWSMGNVGGSSRLFDLVTSGDGLG